MQVLEDDSDIQVMFDTKLSEGEEEDDEMPKVTCPLKTAVDKGLDRTNVFFLVAEALPLVDWQKISKDFSPWMLVQWSSRKRGNTCDKGDAGSSKIDVMGRDGLSRRHLGIVEILVIGMTTLRVASQFIHLEVQHG
ncbi:hypothetical protein Ancab_011242 [Ancistrocladus abbreviatus]